MPAESSHPNLLTFISYRREDASGHAGRLHDILQMQFHPDQLFMDVDAIPPGVDFADHIQDAVARCDVLLALIGPRWLTLADETGQRRLDDPNDFVRLEIEAALKRDVRVVPVLIQGARMPRADDLPDSIRALARRNALELSDARFRFDAERLIEALVEIEAGKWQAPAGAQDATGATPRDDAATEDTQRLRVPPPLPVRRASASRPSPLVVLLPAVAVLAVAGLVGAALMGAFGSNASPTPTAASATSPASPRESGVDFTDIEEELLARLRPDARVACRPADEIAPGASDAIQCGPLPGRYFELSVHRYPSNVEAAGRYIDRVTRNQVRLGSGDCRAGDIGDSAWAPGDGVPGDPEDDQALRVDGDWYQASRSGCDLAGRVANFRATCGGGLYVAVQADDDDLRALYTWAMEPPPGQVETPTPPGICLGPADA